MFKFFKKLALAALVAAVMTASAVTLVAADSPPTSTDSGTGSVQATIPITGTIQPLIISVTHPISAVYSINPNSCSFIAPSVSLTNNTKTPINVTVQSLSSATGGTVQFQDVMPNAKTWNSLSAADSKKYIALGIGITGATGWNTGYSTATDWAASAAPAQFGSIGSNATGSLNLTADFGQAFDGSYTAMHSLVFMFQLS